MAIVSVGLCDGAGQLLPFGPDVKVEFSVKQGGRFLAVGSPNRGDHASWKVPEIRLHQNKGQLFVEACADSDPIVIEASAEGYGTARIEIAKEAAAPIPEVPEEECRFLDEWFYSQTLIDQDWPDIDGLHAHPNLNFWKRYHPGRGNDENFTGLILPGQDISSLRRPPVFNKAVESARLIHVIRMKVPKPSTAFENVVLHFENIEGRGRVYVYAGDKRYYGEKVNHHKAPYDLVCEGLQPGEEAEVWVVVQAHQTYCAINRPVRWEFR